MSKVLEKDKALAQVMADIEKQFGKGAIMKLGEQENAEIEASKSGSLALDIALGVGGYPKGRIIEIYDTVANTGEYLRNGTAFYRSDDRIDQAGGSQRNRNLFH